MVERIEELGAELKGCFSRWSQGSACILEIARSRFACPGPFTNPVPLFPNAVPMPSAPITGGLLKQDALKYPLSFDSTDPALHQLVF